MKISQRSKDKIGIGIAITGMIAFFSVLVWLIVENAVYKSPGFWILSIFEIIVIAIIFNIPPSKIKFILVLFALILPTVLFLTVKFFKPTDSIVAICVFSIISVEYRCFLALREDLQTLSGKSRGKKRDLYQGRIVSSRQNNRRKYDITIPSYLPPGYREAERYERNRKKSVITEIIYNNYDNEHIIWLTQADGPIPDLKPIKNSVLTEKRINGNIVSFAIKNEKHMKKPEVDENPSFVEASWNNRDISYHIKADGLPVDEVEKIISSMVH